VGRHAPSLEPPGNICHLPRREKKSSQKIVAEVLHFIGIHISFVYGCSVETLNCKIFFCHLPFSFAKRVRKCHDIFENIENDIFMRTLVHDVSLSSTRCDNRPTRTSIMVGSVRVSSAQPGFRCRWRVTKHLHPPSIGRRRRQMAGPGTTPGPRDNETVLDGVHCPANVAPFTVAQRWKCASKNLGF